MAVLENVYESELEQLTFFRRHHLPANRLLECIIAFNIQALELQ